MVDKVKNSKAYGHWETSLDVVWIIAAVAAGIKITALPGVNTFVMYNAPVWQLVATILFVTALYRVYTAFHKAGN